MPNFDSHKKVVVSAFLLIGFVFVNNGMGGQNVWNDVLDAVNDEEVVVEEEETVEAEEEALPANFLEQEQKTSVEKENAEIEDNENEVADEPVELEADMEEFGDAEVEPSEEEQVDDEEEGPESESVLDSDPEPEAEDELESQDEPEVAPEAGDAQVTEVESESEIGSEPEAESESESEPEVESDPGSSDEVADVEPVEDNEDEVFKDEGKTLVLDEVQKSEETPVKEQAEDLKQIEDEKAAEEAEKEAAKKAEQAVKEAEKEEFFAAASDKILYERDFEQTDVEKEQIKKQKEEKKLQVTEDFIYDFYISKNYRYKFNYLSDGVYYFGAKDVGTKYLDEFDFNDNSGSDSFLDNALSFVNNWVDYGLASVVSLTDDIVRRPHKHRLQVGADGADDEVEAEVEDSEGDEVEAEIGNEVSPDTEEENASGVDEAVEVEESPTSPEPESEVIEEERPAEVVEPVVVEESDDEVEAESSEEDAEEANAGEVDEAVEVEESPTGPEPELPQKVEEESDSTEEPVNEAYEFVKDGGSFLEYEGKKSEEKLVERIKKEPEEKVAPIDLEKVKEERGMYLDSKKMVFLEEKTLSAIYLEFSDFVDYKALTLKSFYLEGLEGEKIYPNVVFVGDKEVIMIFEYRKMSEKEGLKESILLSVEDLKSKNGATFEGYISFLHKTDKLVELTEVIDSKYEAYIGDDIVFNASKLTFGNMHDKVETDSTISVEIGGVESIDPQCSILVFGNNLQHELGADEMPIQGLTLISKSDGDYPVNKSVVNNFEQEKNKKFLGFVYVTDLDSVENSHYLHLNLRSPAGLTKGKYQAQMSFELFCPVEGEVAI